MKIYYYRAYWMGIEEYENAGFVFADNYDEAASRIYRNYEELTGMELHEVGEFDGLVTMEEILEELMSCGAID